MKYFFDNCISYRFADMLAALQVDAVSLRSEFAEAIKDVEFLEKLRDAHDVYVTHDHRQKTREAEARAIKESGVTALWLGRFWGRMEFWQQAKWLISRWELIDKYATSCAPGTCAEIKQNGRSEAFAL